MTYPKYLKKSLAWLSLNNAKFLKFEREHKEHKKVVLEYLRKKELLVFDKKFVIPLNLDIKRVSSSTVSLKRVLDDLVRKFKCETLIKVLKAQYKTSYDYLKIR